MGSDNTDLRFPIGKFADHGPITEDHISAWIADLAALPDDLRRTVTSLSDAQLDTPYAPAAGPSARWSVTCPTAT